MTNGLQPAPAGEIARLTQSARCSYSASSFPNWEARLLDPERDPTPHMRGQLQKRNDCQGQALCNGVEKREWYTTGEMRQRSDMFAYNASEYIDGSVGMDRGTSITSGVRLLVEGIPTIGLEPGIALEEHWNYSQYIRSTNEFTRRAQAVAIESGHVTDHQPCPHFEDMLASVAAGGTGHIGTWWGRNQWSKRGDTRELTSVPSTGGGHATEVVWARKIDGAWYLQVWNSHGDRYYFIGERVWNGLVDLQFQPFGGFLLMPPKADEVYSQQRWADGMVV